MQAYTGQSRHWRGRYAFLFMYTDLLIDFGSFVPSDADAEALRRIAKDTSKPVVERFRAQHVRGHCLWAQGKRDEAARVQKTALEIAALATPAHRAELVPIFVRDGSMRWVPVGERSLGR